MMISLEDSSSYHPTPTVECTMKDRISELPEEILISVLSRLTMKEAGRTSVLARRWRHVWAYITALDFGAASEIFGELHEIDPISKLAEEVPKYLSWVDQVVSSHKSATVSEFKVQFDLGANCQHNVDNWIRYAVEKRVKSLQIDLKPAKRTRELNIAFPSISFCNSLMTLMLQDVDVTGEVIEKLLHDCQALESLSLSYSKTLVDLKVAGSSLNLKSLSIRDCFKMKYLQISAPNLISLDYSGPRLSYPFKSSPKLANVSIGGDYGLYLLECDFPHLSSCSSHIEVLHILPFILRVQRIAKWFPVCPRLKTLVVKMHAVSDEGLFGLCSLMKACPLLEKFVLTFASAPHLFKRSEKTKRVEQARNIEACPLDSLKIVEIVGFSGCEVKLGFVKYLIKNAVSMEKITVVLPDIDMPYFDEDFSEAEDRKRRAKAQAEQLRSNIRHGIEFEIQEPKPFRWWDSENSFM